MRRSGEETRRRVARAGILTGAVVALVAAGAAVLVALVARAVVTPARRLPDDIRIDGVRPADGDERGDAADAADPGALVTISATAETTVRGHYGLSFSGGTGYARVGDIVERTADTVTRRVEAVDEGDLASARGGRWSGWYYRSPEGLGLDYEEVDIPTELGAQSAWLVPAAEPSSWWAVLVHGRGVTRAETLRALPVFRDAGFTALAISYRNDPGAVASADHRYALGVREWRDVAAALDWAVGRGAERFVLGGWSMGGATSLQTLSRWDGADRILGVALDSPVIDWRDVLREQTRVRRLPAPIGSVAQDALGRGWSARATGLAEPIDLDSLDWVARADELRAPLLIQHSTADRTVPVGPSRRLAALRPDLVSLHVWDEAQHTRLWNVDPERYSANLRGWLNALPRR